MSSDIPLDVEAAQPAADGAVLILGVGVVLTTILVADLMSF